MTSERATMAGAAGRAVARATFAAVRARRSRPTRQDVRHGRTADGRTVELRPVRGRRGVPRGVAALAVGCDGEHVGDLWTRADAGTATYEIVPRFPSVERTVDADVAATALRLVLDDVRGASPDLRIAVRRPLDPLVSGPDPEVLAGLGLTHVATFPGDPASPQAWPGEERWELLA